MRTLTPPHLSNCSMIPWAVSPSSMHSLGCSVFRRPSYCSSEINGEGVILNWTPSLCSGNERIGKCCSRHLQLRVGIRSGVVIRRKKSNVCSPPYWKLHRKPLAPTDFRPVVASIINGIPAWSDPSHTHCSSLTVKSSNFFKTRRSVFNRFWNSQTNRRIQQPSPSESTGQVSSSPVQCPPASTPSDVRFQQTSRIFTTSSQRTC